MNNCSDVRFTLALIAGLWLLASVSGCGSKVPFEIVPVHGKVSYEDGSLIPADSILVTFNPTLKGEKGKTVAPGGQTERECPGWNLFWRFQSPRKRRCSFGTTQGGSRFVRERTEWELGPVRGGASRDYRKREFDAVGN